jgi:hypothetical protein
MLRLMRKAALIQFDGGIDPANMAQGFAHADMATALGVIGIVFAIILAAGSMAHSNDRLQTAVNESLVIADGFRNIYSRRGGVLAPDWTDVTCVGVNAGVFPKDMLRADATCSKAYPRHPWNGSVTIYAIQSWQGIVIRFNDLGQAVCKELAERLSVGSDVMFEDINSNVQTYLPPLGSGTALTSGQIETGCQDVGMNYVDIGVRAL